MCQRMTFRSDSFPLHKTLLEHKPSILVNKIKTSPQTNFRVRDRKGVNLLQLAASRGFIEAVLWLLYEGVPIDQKSSTTSNNLLNHAEKTPLYLAIESGQWLTAQIFLCCGAEINKAQELAKIAEREDILKILQDIKIDPDIFTFVLFWAVKNYNEHFGLHLINLLEPQIQKHSEEKKSSIRMSLLPPEEDDKISLKHIVNSLQGLIDFAASQNKTAIVRALLRMSSQQYNTNPFHATLGFWLAKYDNEELFKQIADNTSHVVLTLTQIDEYGLKKMGTEIDYFDKYFLQATPDQQNAFLQANQHADGDFKLTPTQLRIFNKTKFAKDTHFKLLHARNQLPTDDAKDTLHTIIIDAAKENEPLLLEHKSTTNDEKSIKKKITLDKDYQRVLELMNSKKNFVAIDTLLDELGTDSIFECAMESKNRDLFLQVMFTSNLYVYEWVTKYPEYAKTLIELMGHEQSGVLHRILDSATADSLNDFRTKQETLAHQSYLNLLGFNKNEFVRIYFNSQLQRRDILAEKDTKEIPARILTIAENSARRIGFSLTLDNKPCLSSHISPFFTTFSVKKGPAKNLLEFLNTKDKACLSGVSTMTFDLCNNNLAAKIHKFLAKLESEIKAKPWHTHRNFHLTNRERNYSFLFFLASAVSLASWTLLGSTVQSQNNIRRLMHVTPSLIARDRYCNSRIFANDPNMCSHRYYEDTNCERLCDDLETGQKWLVGTSVIGCVLTLALILIAWKKQEIRSTAQKIKNGLFSDGRRFNDATINDFSTGLQLDYQRILIEFAAHPSFNLNAHSHIGQIRQGLTSLVEQMSAPQSLAQPSVSG